MKIYGRIMPSRRCSCWIVSWSRMESYSTILAQFHDAYEVVLDRIVESSLDDM